MPSVLWRCWTGGRKGIRPVKTEWWGAGMVICLEQGADLHMAQLIPLPLTVSCFSKIQIGLPFWYQLTWVVPEKGPLNGGVCVCVISHYLPSVLWHCWLGGRKGIQPVENLSGGVLTWLSVWSEMQTCTWPSWCHCHSLSLASTKSRLVLHFWYRLTRLVPEKGPLNGVCHITLLKLVFSCRLLTS